MKQQSNRSPAEQLEDIVEELGELYARADVILDELIAEARERKQSRPGGKPLN